MSVFLEIALSGRYTQILRQMCASCFTEIYNIGNHLSWKFF